MKRIFKMLKIQRGCTPLTKKCFYYEWNLGKKIKNSEQPVEMPSCCIKHLREIIWYLTDLFEQEQIPYWADFGTLLGAVREGRTIPHDTDGDLCTFLVNRQQILNLKNKINKDGFGIQNTFRKNDNHIKIFRSKKNHMTVDIFFWSYDEDKQIFRSPGLNVPKSFPDWWVEKFTKVKLFDKEIWSPRDPEHFLRMRFGKNWNKPYNIKVHYGDAIKTHRYGFEYARKLGWGKMLKI
jgi:hypothetical protein